MAVSTQYTIAGPIPYSEDDFDETAHRSLSIRRGGKSDSLRILYRTSASLADPDGGTTVNGVTASPHLPPTPPGAEDDERHNVERPPDLDHDESKRSLVTPVNQLSPPTPDNTPPARKLIRMHRLGLDVRPSFISSRAESFKTAREDLATDSESQIGVSARQYSFHSLRQTPPILPQLPTHESRNSGPVTSTIPNPTTQLQKGLTLDGGDNIESSTPQPNGEISSTPRSPPLPAGFRHVTSDEVARRLSYQKEVDEVETIPADNVSPTPVRHSIVSPDASRVRRGPSLRDRLTVNQALSPSTEKFANIIGWNEAVTPDSPKETRRWSAMSGASAIGALVFDTPQSLPRRNTTLRHVSRHESLRSVSSPMPVSNRVSLISNPNSDSPHRLVHRKTRVTNQNRWSYGSEVSKAHSIASSAVLPKTEVIKVAVIPERRSSLSAPNSKRNSQLTAASGPSRRLSQESPSKTEGESSGSSHRDRRYPPVVPQRGSSLSAPTSANTSRANSITSEHLRVRRQEAEVDLRRTLERMESDRLVTSLKQMESAKNVPGPVTPRLKKTSAVINDTLLPPNMEGGRTPQRSVEGGSEDWAALRTSMSTWTPFSHPSGKSMSPIETGEAQAINYFQHHNHSLQVIESNPLPESRAVRIVRKQPLDAEELDIPTINSPLRNPREAPQPPDVNVLSPSSAGETEQQRMERFGSIRRNLGSQRRPQPHSRTGSFVQSLTRGLSLKNARNKKADQDLDSNLHPFWRPKAFWDDIDNDRRDRGVLKDGEYQSISSSSLALPEEPKVSSGPGSLVRRLSERRQLKKALRQRPSYDSLIKVRAGSKLFFLSGGGIPTQLGNLRDLRDRLLFARQRKEDERREKRRDELRQKIGNIVAQTGDSRFQPMVQA